MDAQERARLIATYRDGHRVVVEALDGITDAELDRADGDGWSPRQVVHHLADSEMTSAMRIRRLLAQPGSEIQGYDEKAFAQRLTMDRPIEPSLEAMRWARESTAQLLDRMTDADWNAVGSHSESGRYSAEDWLRIYAAHAHDHAGQIRRARGKA
jgi:enoyl reductase-like protein